MRRSIIFLLLAALSAAVPAAAAVVPSPSSSDRRVRVVEYAPDQVVLLNATLGYAIAIQYDAGERLESVSVGNSIDWQLVPNKQANILFVKPVHAAPATNMTVVTNLRIYHFELRSRKSSGPHDPNVIFALRFDYPAPAMAQVDDAAPAGPAVINQANASYTYDGSSLILPVRVFDDGVQTYFLFPPNIDLPAIFAVDRDGKEVTVNVANREGYLVVDRLAQAFVLRRGTEVTRIANDGFAASQAIETTLRPRDERARRQKPKVSP